VLKQEKDYKIKLKQIRLTIFCILSALGIMRLSKLQKHILIKSYESRLPTAKRSDFYDFYKNTALDDKREFIQKTVHKSLERLTGKGLMTSFGKKTSEKWFIHEVSLTEEGRQVADKLVRKNQPKLPIK